VVLTGTVTGITRRRGEGGIWRRIKGGGGRRDRRGWVLVVAGASPELTALPIRQDVAVRIRAATFVRLVAIFQWYRTTSDWIFLNRTFEWSIVTDKT
jgi:hypothetical protein